MKKPEPPLACERCHQIAKVLVKVSTPYGEFRMCRDCYAASEHQESTAAPKWLMRWWAGQSSQFLDEMAERLREAEEKAAPPPEPPPLAHDFSDPYCVNWRHERLCAKCGIPKSIGDGGSCWPDPSGWRGSVDRDAATMTNGTKGENFLHQVADYLRNNKPKPEEPHSLFDDNPMVGGLWRGRSLNGPWRLR